jgi:tetraacyldisaccharide 4'-kinase
MERPAILSRGYARPNRADGVVVVSDGRNVRADVLAAGDEPLMLARALPGVAVLVSPDRYLSGRIAETHLGCTVHLLDDGFQHFELERDIDLLLVSQEDLDNPRMLPAGHLREPIDVAGTADAAVVSGADLEEIWRVARQLGIAEAFQAVRTAEPPTLVEPAGRTVAPAPGTRVLGVAGIARPERFFASLREAGWVVRRTALRSSPLLRVTLSGLWERREPSRSVIVLTTEKDLMRLLPQRPFQSARCRALRLSIRPAGPFRRWLAGRLDETGGGQRRSGRADAGSCAVKHRLERLIARRHRSTPVAVVAGNERHLHGARGLPSRRRTAASLANRPRLVSPRRSAQDCQGLLRALRARAPQLQVLTLTPEQMLERVEFEGDERARQAYALGRGVLFFTGHFGYWELCGIVHALKIGPIGVLARALDNPHLNRLLEQARQSTGNTVIYRRGALRRVMRALEANQGVAMLIDQHTLPPDAVPVDFFNRAAAATSSLAALAIRRARPRFRSRSAADCRYRMIYEHRCAARPVRRTPSASSRSDASSDRRAPLRTRGSDASPMARRRAGRAGGRHVLSLRRRRDRSRRD